MRKAWAFLLVSILFSVAVACGGGSSSTTASAPQFAPTRGISVDDLPFDIGEGDDPFIFAGKMWMGGPEKVAAKTDHTASNIWIWSSSNGTSWTKVVNADDLPWDVDGDGEIFIFNGKAYYYGAAKTGPDMIWSTTNMITWTEVAELDDFPFYTNFDQEPIEFGGKAWFLGEEKVPEKVDRDSGDIYLWSTTNFTSFTKGAMLSELPMSLEYSSPFVFDNKLYVYAYPNTADKLDMGSSDARFYYTTNGTQWIQMAIDIYTAFHMSASPGYTDFLSLGRYLICLAWYMGSSSTKMDMTDDDDSDEGQYVWYSKDINTWVRGKSTDEFEFETYCSTCWFVFNNALWAIADTKEGATNPGRYFWKVTK